MNLTSKVHIRFTFSVTLGIYTFCNIAEFLAKCLTKVLAVLLGQTDIWNCFVVFQTLYFLMSQFLWKQLKMFYGNLVGKHWSEQWKDQFVSNNLYSYQWMQPYYRHNWEIRGHEENTDGIKNCRWCNWINRKWRENYIHVTGNRKQRTGE